MKGLCTGKRSMATVFMITMIFCLSTLLVTGCAKKEVVKEEAAATMETKAEPLAPPPAEVKTQEPEATPQPMKEEAGEMKKEAAAAPEQPAPYEFIDIHFDFDKYNLRPGDREILKKHGEWLVKNSDYSVRIEGNCDERGTAEYNLALGERRAREAKKYLIELGVAEKRTNTVSYGKERPLDPGHNEEAWAKNRRDHFVITPTK